MKIWKLSKALEKIVVLLLCTALLFTAFVFNDMVRGDTAPAYWTTNADTDFEGSGSEADPYRIYTADEFYGMIRISGKVNGTPAYFKLMNDLYFNNVMDGTSVTSIQNPRNWYTDALKDSSFLFAGHFDGDFHTVYGLYCNPTSTTYGQVGLFPNIATGSTIKNVSLSNSYLKIRAYVGGIAGSVTGGGTTPAVISRCTVDDTVTLEANECSAGGIVGRFTDACTIEDCASFATLIADKGYTGLFGETWGSTQRTLKNSFIVGYEAMSRGDRAITTLSNVYTNKTDSKNYVGKGANILEDSQMKGAAALDNMKLSSNVWVATESYPALNTNYDPTYKVWSGGSDTTFEGNGTEAEPYLIYTAEELFGMISLSGKANGTPASYKLMNDIRLNDVAGRAVTDLAAPNSWNQSAITNTGKPFAGKFDGNGKTVYGLYASTTAATRLGLFPNITTDAVIKNVTLSNSYIETASYVGGIVGGMSAGTNKTAYIGSCGVTDDVTIICSGNNLAAAGIIGMFQLDCIMENCYSLATLKLTQGTGYTGLFGDYWGNTSTRYVTNCFISGYEAVCRNTAGIVPVNVYTDKANAANYINRGVTVLASEAMQGTEALETMKLPSSYWQATAGYPTHKVYSSKNDPTIKTFTLGGQKGIIDENNKTITVTFYHDVLLSNITPVIETTASGATISPANITDFSKPVTLTVTAPDGVTSQNYKIYAVCQSNLALLAKASAISSYRDNNVALDPSSLNDGNLNPSHDNYNRWSSLAWDPTTLATEPIWAQYEWENPVTFDTVEIYEWLRSGNPHLADEFTISVSDNGTSFTEVYRGNGIGKQKVITLSSPQTAKYLRFTLLSAESAAKAMPSFSEIEVYYRAGDAFIEEFTIDGTEGIINEVARTITVATYSNTDFSSVTPTVKVSSGASYTPKGKQDFTDPVIYTVTAKDGKTTRSYTVTVMDKTQIQITDDMLTDKGSADVSAFGPVPSTYQYDYQKQELSAFLHFGINTFTNKEWGDGTEPTSTFALSQKIDAENYVQTIKEAGFKKLIVTAKHHDGFCLWDSKYTDYDIASTNYPGDVLEDISAACSKYGIEMGLYLSPWDRHDPSYGYYDKDGNPTDEANDYLDYNDYYVNQLIEIFENEKYGCNGHFAEIWLDGAKGEGADAQSYDFDRFVSTMYQYEGKAAGYPDNPLIFGTNHNTVRWIGNELGIANEENWSKATGTYNSSTGIITVTNQGPSVEYSDTKAAMGVKEGNLWIVPEADARITSYWFWGPTKNTPKSIDELKDMYLKSVGHNSVLLLNLPLNTSGKLDTAMRDRVLEFGAAVKASFEDNNLLSKGGVTISASEVRNDDIKFKPSNVADGNDQTYWTAETGSKVAAINVNFGQKVTFDSIVLEEDIRFGQRVEKFVIKYKNSAGQWVEFSSGTTVGAKRVVLEKPVSTEEISIVFTGMTSSSGEVATPVISHIGVHRASSDFAAGSTAPDGIDEYDSADTSVFTANGWTTADDNACIGSSQLVGTAGDILTATFNGTIAWLVGEIGTSETVLSVSVDSGEAKTVTLKGNVTEKLARIFETDTLSGGKHTIKVTVMSGTAKIDGLYVLNNGAKGMLDFEKSEYTVDEDMYFNVKIVRKGGTSGTLKAIVQDNPGSAVQSSYYTTAGITIEFADGEREKTVTFRTKRYTEKTGTLSFFLALVPADANEIVIGFNAPCVIKITDAESYENGYLTSLKINSVPSKIKYRVGETLDLTGLVVSGNYASGDTRTLQADQYTVSVGTINNVGLIPVTITALYDGTVASFTVMSYADGDTNQNGTIDIADLVSLAKGKATAGDINRDGAQNALDRELLRKHLIGKNLLSNEEDGRVIDVLNDVKWTSGYFSTDGSVHATSNAVYAYSEPIKANFIIFENNENTVWTNFAEYDENGNCVLNPATGKAEAFCISNDVNTVIITKPGHSYRIMVRYKNQTNFSAQELLSKHGPAGIFAADNIDPFDYVGYAFEDMNGNSDTVWNAVGDSITYGSYYYLTNTVKYTNYKANNYGLAGSTLAVNDYSRNHINSVYGTSHAYTSVVERVLNDNMPTADVWTIFAGTNDCYYGSPIGSLKAKGSAFDTSTVYGALQTICEYVLAQENTPRLILISPAFSNREPAPNAKYDLTYDEVIKAFREVSALYGVEHLELWSKAGINADNADLMLKDGVHPSTAGGLLLSSAIAAQLSLGNK